jgi:pyruvate/2-oxoglutarate dehydrogenase complex dihydrolipoamide dehydrogenase (E3) component
MDGNGDCCTQSCSVTQRMSADSEFDFAVIGGGSAGYAAARTAVAQGLRTVVIDGAEALGGLCILRGCMPSKTLIESANRNLTIRRAAEFGLQAHAGAPDVHVIRDRKRRLIDDFASYRQGQLGDGRFTLVRGYARFINAHEIEVNRRDGGTQNIRFKSACIATGSVVNVPPMPGLNESGYWTSDDILDAEVLPSSFIVLGGGAIALEMAHYLDGMDRKVTLIQRSARLLGTMDAECGVEVEKAFKERGIQVFCGTNVRSVEKIVGGKRVIFLHGDQTVTVEAEEILVAAGRSPAIKGLELSNAGIEINGGQKITVNSHMQSTQPHVYAAGDVCSPLDIVHIAIQQGECAAWNAAALLRGEVLPANVDYRLALFGVFCAPQAACVGATEEELRRAGIEFATASYPFNDHGKSMVMGETDGFVKLIARTDTGEVVGASVVGPEETELIHEIVVAMHFRATVRQLAEIPHYHPTLSEIWTYPAEELADSLRL